MDKHSELQSLIYLLRKQFYIGAASGNTCTTEYCIEKVRGTGHCARCLTKDIIDLTGGTHPAIMLRRSLGFQKEAISTLMDLIEDK